MRRNPHIARLCANYLFPEINARKRRFLAENPHVSLISLGIGDTTEPLPRTVCEAFTQASARLGTREGYSGYGSEQGSHSLKEKIASRIYGGLVDASEVFISDGAKCDVGRLQALFGRDVSIAVQDPAYPVYLEGSLIHGVADIVSLPCLPENDFFPHLNDLPKVDVIYFCSPNNPTGAVATRQQLERLVSHARAHSALIVFDAAYASYISDPALPKSIFEIDGAREVAIEIGSFSKLAGFTGVRLGWTVVPAELTYDDGSSVQADWRRLTSTLFNGASNLAQSGGCAVLEDGGWEQATATTRFYLENARILRKAFETLGYEVFGGQHAPYLWVRFPGQDSWAIFQHFLEEYHIVTTPGAGFGPGGEHFLRFSSFGHRDHIVEGVSRLSKLSSLVKGDLSI